MLLLALMMVFIGALSVSGQGSVLSLDEAGRLEQVLNSQGAPTSFAYMPYGYANHSGSTSTPFQWLGGYGVYYDSATDLHLTMHRAYSSTMKRFIHPDPLGIDGGVNVYMWANMNPLAFIDPYGLCAEGSYWGRSYDQLIRGNFTDDVTLLGTGMQIGTGLLGVDLPGDIRDLDYDLKNWRWAWSHAGQTVLDAVGLFPVIGALKYADEGSTLLKQADNLAPAKRMTGTTVLGHNPEYVDLADSLGHRRFDIPTDAWERMTEAERWTANQKFLDRTISRGDEIILSTPLDNVRPNSYFARELEYLSGKGYTPSPDGTRLIPGGN